MYYDNAFMHTKVMFLKLGKCQFDSDAERRGVVLQDTHDPLKNLELQSTS